ncbi:MAG: CBS domain-containing protein [Bacteriovoracaceae bacterium]|nr:CBS domain-containing protein [Bacteriovoracaceae bacterium]
MEDRGHSVQDFMAKKLITFTPDTSISEVIESLLKNNISGAPVLDENKQLVGVISERDCLKVDVSYGYFYANNLPDGTVKDFMSTTVETVKMQANIIDVAVKFTKLHYRRFPVVDEDGALVGQISRRDVLRAVHHMKRGK